MEIGGINAISIGAAAVAGFIAAAIYYNLVGKQWQAATGIDDQRMHEIIGPACFITAGISQILIAGILAGLFYHFGPDSLTIRSALITGGVLWLGFVATPMAVNHRFQGKPWALTVVDSGSWLVVIAVQGVVLGLMGI